MFYGIKEKALEKYPTGIQQFFEHVGNGIYKSRSHYFFQSTESPE